MGSSFASQLSGPGKTSPAVFYCFYSSGVKTRRLAELVRTGFLTDLQSPGLDIL